MPHWLPLIVLNLILLILPAVKMTFPYQWRGLTTNVSTILRDTVLNGNGCDSIHFVQSVTILPSVDSTLVVTVCQDNLPLFGEVQATLQPANTGILSAIQINYVIVFVFC